MGNTTDFTTSENPPWPLLQKPHNWHTELLKRTTCLSESKINCWIQTVNSCCWCCCWELIKAKSRLEVEPCFIPAVFQIYCIYPFPSWISIGGMFDFLYNVSILSHPCLWHVCHSWLVDGSVCVLSLSFVFYMSWLKWKQIWLKASMQTFPCALKRLTGH